MRATAQKYGNKRVEIDGIKFDSAFEGKVYLRLKSLQERGRISGLELQPSWVIIPKITERFTKHLKTKDKECERVVQSASHYVADFAFDYNGQRIVADAKGLPTPVYKLKKRLMRYVHGIDVIEIKALKDLNRFEE